MSNTQGLSSFMHDGRQNAAVSHSDRRCVCICASLPEDIADNIISHIQDQRFINLAHKIFSHLPSRPFFPIQNL